MPVAMSQCEIHGNVHGVIYVNPCQQASLLTVCRHVVDHASAYHASAGDVSDAVVGAYAEAAALPAAAELTMRLLLCTDS